MKTLSRHLSVAALFAWGSLMLYFYVSGRLTNYVAPFLKPMVLLSSLFLLGIGLCILFGGRQPGGGLSTEDTGRELYAPARVRVTKWVAFALLVLPVWVAAGVSKDRYGDSAILNKGISNTLSPGYAGKSTLVPAPVVASVNPPPQPAAVEPPLPGATPLPADSGSALDAAQYLKTTADGHVIAEVTDLLFAAEDESMRPLFEKRTIEMIGQFLPVKEASDKRFQIVRMFMVCCAADARPIAVAVVPPVKTDAKAKTPVEMAWTRVVGTVDFPLENGRRIPIVHAQTTTPCDPPSEAMLY